MFNLLSALLNEIFSYKPVDVQINSKPLALFNFQHKMDNAFYQISKQTTKARSRTIVLPKYSVYEKPMAIDSDLDFSL